ncbi:MAG: recombinase family protein, partial [Elusimicrobiota bacterium]
MKAAIYVRVSTDKQEEKNQEYQLRDFAEKNSWQVYDVYKDIISGKEEKRPGFERLFQDARKLKYDIVLFWDISRFSRAGTHHTLQKLRELENKGIQWHSYNDPYLSSLGDFKDVVISILSTLAKIEREKISQRTIAGLERAKKQ